MLSAAVLGLLLPAVTRAQTQPSAPLAPAITAAGARPVPGPVYEIPEFTRAVERGTRTRSGRPGAFNWVQHARYTIDARLDVAANRIWGQERAVYINNSPDTLHRLAVYLRQNAFAAGNPRRQPAPITGGVSLQRVAVNGRTVSARSASVTAVPITDVANARPADSTGYTVDGTVLWIPLAAPLLPHDSVRLDFAWSYVPPPSPSDGRQGRESHLYFMGYWYPQVAVYDDVNGWVADPYLLEAEFYMDPADYDVRLTVPHGWVVGATGTLRNPAEVLSAAARARLAQARRTGGVVHVVEPGAAAAGAFAGGGATATWHFTAADVRDFSWGTSDRYVWDATRALVGAGAGGAARDTVDISSFYRRTAAASAWALGGARFTRDAVEQHSAYLWPYPWPQMTSMEGVLDSGGMEYPMVTLMQPWADTLSLAGDLMHETGHMWFPMQVGSSETRYPWMDEGFTQYDVAQGMRALYGEPRAGGRPGDSEPGQRELYLAVARAGHDLPLMWPGDLYPQDLYFIMYYDKTAQVLAALRGVLGEETFHRAFREYGRRWIGRHPYPYDFFNTMADVAGRDLSWFWNTWFYRAWPLDQAVASVQPAGDSTAITVEDRGLAPMPVLLAVTRSDGSVQHLDIPVSVWLGGARRYVARVASTPAVVQVEIDPAGLFPDMDRTNQRWTRAGVTGMRAVPPAAASWWHDITVLADDSLRGRATGTADYLKAARYVAAQFQAAGLQPIGTDGYFQTAHLSVARLVPEHSGVALVTNGIPDTLALGSQALIDVSTTTAPRIDAPMVFVGYGLHFPGVRDDLGHTSVRGKVAVYLNRLPSGLSATMMAHSRSGRWEALRAAGAVAAIAVTEPPAPGSRAARLGVRARTVATGLADDPTGGGLLITMPGSAAERLFAGSGHTYASLLAQANADSAAVLPTFALHPTLHAWTELARTPLDAPNVLGVLRGSDPALRDQYVIVSAHLDHLGVGRPVNGDSIYNGAMDNASGIATMLETARAFHARGITPKRSLIFAAVTGEEKGELGSAYLATHPPVPAGQIVADLNTDMWEPLIPLTGIFGYGADESDLGNDLRQALRTHGLSLLEDPHPEQVRFIRSDQYSFIKRGIPALALKIGYTGGSAGDSVITQWIDTRYHKPSDDLDQPVDFQAAIAFDSLYVDLVRLVADRPTRPAWNRGSVFASVGK